MNEFINVIQNKWRRTAAIHPTDKSVGFLAARFVKQIKADYFEFAAEFEG